MNTYPGEQTLRAAANALAARAIPGISGICIDGVKELLQTYVVRATNLDDLKTSLAVLDDEKAPLEEEKKMLQNKIAAQLHAINALRTETENLDRAYPGMQQAYKYTVSVDIKLLQESFSRKIPLTTQANALKEVLKRFAGDLSKECGALDGGVDAVGQALVEGCTHLNTKIDALAQLDLDLGDMDVDQPRTRRDRGDMDVDPSGARSVRARRTSDQ